MPVRATALVATLALILAVPAASRAAWVDVAPGTPLAEPMNSTGIAWGDFDNDGDLDLYLSKSGSACRLFRNDGQGVWVDVAAGTPLEDGGNGRGAAWGDYDNDGDLDLFVASSGTPDKLFRNENHGAAWVNVAATTPLADAGYGRSVAWADYDRDGDLDLFLANWQLGGSISKLFRNDNNGALWSFPNPSLLDGGNGNTVSWADYDDDGDLDLYEARSGSQANRLYRNDGDGAAWVDVAAGSILADAASGYGVAWGDYDDDGDLDLFLATDIGPNRLFRNDGHGASWVDIAAGTPLAGEGFGRGAASADFDNDGDLDLYVANATMPGQLFRNDPGNAWVDVAPSTPLAGLGNAQAVAWGDFDGDGDLDLYATYLNVPNRLFRNDGEAAGNHWLRVEPAGNISNRSAIGARVSIEACGVRQMREISGGSGYLSQDAPVASFGLGGVTTVESLVIRWPTGESQRFAAVAADQVLRVTEASTLDSGERPASIGVRIAGASPNPFARSTSIEYVTPRSGRVRLEVLDLQGRRLATLVDVLEPAGRHAAHWDGRAENGAALGSGLYLVRLDAAGITRTRKVALVR